VKKYSLSFLFLFFSIILFSVSTVMGAYIDSNGTLIEPAFFFIPTGFLLLTLSFSTAIYVFIKKRKT
jgi:hypothetical protein